MNKSWTTASLEIGAPAPPGPGDTSLCLLPEAAIDEFVGAVDGLELLTRPERDRMERKRTAQGRRRFLAGRVLSRFALSARTGLPLEIWRFQQGEDGRPEPDPASTDCRFNISHTDGLVACVVTQGSACGVDVERTPARADVVAHIPRYYADAEQQDLNSVPADQRGDRVITLWVLKEAYLKALGVGMRRALDTFTISAPAATAIRVDDRVRDPYGHDRWQFDLVRPGTGHVVAVAVQDGRPGALHLIDLPN